MRLCLEAASTVGYSRTVDTKRTHFHKRRMGRERSRPFPTAPVPSPSTVHRSITLCCALPLTHNNPGYVDFFEPRTSNVFFKLVGYAGWSLRERAGEVLPLMRIVAAGDHLKKIRQPSSNASTDAY
jgi:hypothetical protein